MMRVQTKLTRTPLLVLDVRDWFATTFGTGPKPSRPRSDLVVTAEPLNPATPWPVVGPLELVTTRTPVGMLGAFSRVRRPGGPLLQYRLPPGNYRLVVRDPPPPAYPVYQPAERASVAIPPEGMPATVVPGIELLPGELYPFASVRSGKPGPTIAWGAVRQPDGAGEEGVRVRLLQTPPAPFGQRSVTDDAGRWAVVLDPAPGQPGPVAPLSLMFGFPSGRLVRVPLAAPEPGQVVTVHQASLVGEARIGGRTAAGVRVTVAGQPGAAESGPDGRWQFFFPLGAALPPAVVVTGTALGGRTTTQTAQPKPGAAASVAPLNF